MWYHTQGTFLKFGSHEAVNASIESAVDFSISTCAPLLIDWLVHLLCVHPVVGAHDPGCYSFSMCKWSDSARVDLIALMCLRVDVPSALLC